MTDMTADQTAAAEKEAKIAADKAATKLARETKAAEAKAAKEAKAKEIAEKKAAREAAKPSIPSMKFQTLTRTGTSTPAATATRSGTPCNARAPARQTPAASCASRRGQTGKGRWSSHHPADATSSSPTPASIQA